MDSKTRIKIMLDLIMTLMFIVLLDAYGTGLAFHEITGLFIGALFTIHILLNWSWVKGMTKNLFSPKLKTRSKLMYALNIISLISVSTIIFTGIQISHVVFNSGFPAENDIAIAVHKWTAYFCLALFAVHICLHRQYISETVRKLSGSMKEYHLGKAVKNFGAAALILGLLYTYGISNLIDQRDQAAPINETPSGRKDEVYQYERDKWPDSNQSTITGDTEENTGLKDFLGSMFCNGCHNHCPLLNLGCDKGNSQLEAAKAQYQELYGEDTLN